ncbi:hypothetical protein GCM10007887_38080 [Methylobacterium haplocladii]|uniref:Uncharacterized protein n=1 Tax=Methylobacterium haplocladii TaxID=1176176 RepID=A0A512IVX6_9HYPH|nr:hypothetical protein MHA02_42490 [Methylobacterium haplocladii]GLS61114.1 hypothetical protein GCM10007887_38080 [Methylobacterium haplocladii]
MIAELPSAEASAPPVTQWGQTGEFARPGCEASEWDPKMKDLISPIAQHVLLRLIDKAQNDRQQNVE